MRRIAHGLIALTLLAADAAPALAYVDGGGRMDVDDVMHQIAWYRDHGFLKNAAGAEKIVDKRFVVPMTLGQ